MVRLAGAFIIGRVTRRAVAERGAKVSTMALIAGERAMRTAECERRARAVVPLNRGPCGGAVAVLALAAEAGAVAVILLAYPVAVVASRRRAFDDAILVAVAARRGQVATLEGEESRLMKRARSIHPGGIDAMALSARGAELAAMWVRMAGGAIAAQACKAYGRSRPAGECSFYALMAVVASCGCVPPLEKRSGIPMGVALDSERLCGVTALAPLAEMSEVGVFVARGTRCGSAAVTSVLPIRSVALTARHAFVFPRQRKCRLVVVEPCRGELRRVDGMAVPAFRELALVYVAMARDAVRGEIFVDARLSGAAMALVALQ